ncbi:MAG: Tetratricopeptide repeat, partial [Planctomycetota bacterium]
MTRCLAILLVAAACAAGDAAPTAREWKPVADAVAAGTADAVTKVQAITSAYPRWPDGHRTLAGLHAQRGEWLECYRAAQAAIRLTPSDAVAGEMGVLAATQLGRYGVATAAAKALAAIDAKGRIAFQGAAAALAAGDHADAARILAPALAVVPLPPEFLVLQGRIAATEGDHIRAEEILARATGQKRDLSDGWYLLGRERLELAGIQPADRGRWLAQAKDAFEKAVQLRPRDADALTGFGKALLDLAKHVEATGAAGKGDLLVQARGVLGRALAEKPDLVPALLFQGEVHLRTEAWSDAATVLQKAVDLGADDQDSLLLLVKAYGNAGDTAKAAELGRRIRPGSTGERIVLGMNAYRSNDHMLAADLLAAAAGDEGQDAAQRGALWRWTGHAHRRTA